MERKEEHKEEEEEGEEEKVVKKGEKEEGEEEKEDVKEGGVGTVTADVPFYCWDKTQTNSNSGKDRFSFNV